MQGNDYPLHDAAKNKASEVVVTALLSLHPNEANKLDKVRYRRPPLSYSPPRAALLFCILCVSATCSFDPSYVDHMRPTRLPLPCAAW